MITYNKETPIMLVATGNAEIIYLVYSALQQIQPRRLYVFYDASVNKEQETLQVRLQSLLTGNEWKCMTKVFLCKKHHDINAVMKKAIRWFFLHEEEGIVLDGFSVPYPAFFAACSFLLEKYRFDERIGHISGFDFRKPENNSLKNELYFFSKLIHTTGGWASWKRVLKDLEVQMKTFTAFKKQNILNDIPTHKPALFYWYHFNHLDNSWKSCLEYVNLINNRLSVVLNTHYLSLNEFVLPEICHPVFMVNPLIKEIQTQELKYQVPAVTRNEPDGMTFLRKKLLSFNSETGHDMKIPRIIHQIFEDPTGPPPDMLQMAETWKKKMPDWEYRFWNKSMMLDFMETVCPDFISYYNSYPFDVQRWDAIRYLILYHIGGLYVDFDYECVQPLDVLLSGSSCCMGLEPTFNGRIYNVPMIVGNALMASGRKHPFMAEVIEDMKTNFSTYKSVIVASTGPFMTTRVYEKYKKKKEVTLLPADLVAPLTMKEVYMMQTGKANIEVKKKIKNAFAIHYFLGTWTEQKAGKTLPNNNN